MYQQRLLHAVVVVVVVVAGVERVGKSGKQLLVGRGLCR